MLIFCTRRAEQHLIRKSHPMWKTIDEMCFHSKNLYNYANYIIRDTFINDGEYITYYEMNKQLKTTDQYKNCMSQPANCVLRVLDKNWKSFFIAVKDWKQHKEKYLGMPKLPKYLKKNGRFLWMIPNNSCYLEDDELKFRVRKLQGYKWKTKAKGRLIQVRFIPRGSCYVMEIVTKVELPDVELKPVDKIASIDLGVNNFATITNNIGLQPIIIKGGMLKSINQFYNKRRAAIQSNISVCNSSSWSRKLDNITRKRFYKIKNFMHHASKYVVKYCLDNGIDTLVCGLNKEWKQKSTLGKANNQTFINIPYDMFIKQLTYKCEAAGIRFLTVDESYTSGTSFIDGEVPCEENYDIKRRIKRGLFHGSKLLNSDVNGSLQIMMKAFPNAFERYGIEGCLTPVAVNVV